MHDSGGAMHDNAAVINDSADPWPAQANRVRSVLAAGGVVHLAQPEGYVRIVGIGLVLHISRARLDAIQAGQCAIAPSVHCASPP